MEKQRKAVFIKQGVSFEKKPFNKGGNHFKGAFAKKLEENNNKDKRHD